MASTLQGIQSIVFCTKDYPKLQTINLWTRTWTSQHSSAGGLLWKKPLKMKIPPCIESDMCVSKKTGAPRVGTTSSGVSTVECLDVLDDEYDGVLINPDCLPTSANAFASAFQTSLSNWKSKGKKGIWLKILLEQADLIPIAIQEGFDYHHAEPGYVMLTYWIPDEPSLLPSSPSHQIGIGAFVINHNREVLVVKERCPCSCSGVWKIPTGYIDKSEEIFACAVREVKEETGVDTIFQEMVAFRHVHRVAFDKSDLLFICMLQPLSYKITIDETEIQDAKWMPLDEFTSQSYYEEDHMSKRAIEICMEKYDGHYSGFTAHQLTSKMDGKMSYLYYDDTRSLR